MTPLFVAATFGNYNICRSLINAGVSLFTKDESEQMALHRASMEGHLVSVYQCQLMRVKSGQVPEWSWGYLFVCLFDFLFLYSEGSSSGARMY